MKLNKIVVILAVFVIVVMFSGVVQATNNYGGELGEGFNENILNDINVNVNSTPKYDELNNFRNNILGIAITIMQMLSVLGLVFCGVKYMYAGADQKAQLKKGLLGLAIGCIIVFGGATISRYIIDIFSELR